MALGKSLGNILENYFGEENVQLNTQTKSKDIEAVEQVEEEVQVSENIPVQSISIDKIEQNPFQTRVYFDDQKIDSLAKSIRENGLIQPIVVLRRKVLADSSKESIVSIQLKSDYPSTDKVSQTKSKIKKSQELEDVYILLAGERRLRACKSLGWNSILAMVKEDTEIDEKQQSLLSAMENLQREDLTPIELGRTFKMLMKIQGVTEDGLGTILEKTGQYIRNYTRLLTLHPEIQELILQGLLTEGQVRFLVGIEPNLQIKLGRIVAEQELGVMEVRRLVDNMTNPKTAGLPFKKMGHSLPDDYVKRATRFAEVIPNSKLKCFGDEKKGRIIISWDRKQPQQRN
jgi:ParB family transcriptional regulator, chromosome partitioning protein